MAKQKTRFAKVVLLLAITMLVSNTVIQFFENLTKNYAVAVIAFIALMAVFDASVLEAFK